jgi:hypothetical protein
VDGIKPDVGTDARRGAKLGSARPVDPIANGGLVSITIDPSALPGNGTYNIALKLVTTSSAYHASKEAGGGAQLLLMTS